MLDSVYDQGVLVVWGVVSVGEANHIESAPASDAKGSNPGSIDLAYELSGRLPCTNCAYDLAGLSVLERCPECGTLIRDTLLLLVDPFGESVPKVRFPRLLACAILGCTASALCACLALIANRACAMVCASGDILCGLSSLGMVGVIMLFVSAFFGLGLIRPLRSTRASAMAGAILGSILLAGAAAMMAVTLVIRDLLRPVPYVDTASVDSGRVIEHAAAHAAILCAVLVFRPNARAVSSIAWRVRENHDNRQRLLTVATCLVVILVGDALLLVSGVVDRKATAVVAICGGMLIFAGSCILAAALVGVLLDSISIARTLWRIPVAFRDVVRRAAS